MNIFILTTFLLLTFSHHSKACTTSCNTSCCSSCQQCTTTQCLSSCQTQCCQQSNCCQTTDCCSSTSSTTSSSVRPPTSTRESERLVDDSRSHSNDVLANVNSNNFITNTNTINMGIQVTSNVNNTIVNKIPTRSHVTSRPVPPTITFVPPTFTYPPIFPPTYRPPRLPIYPPVYPRCCIIIIPCVSYGCKSHHYSCHGCRGSVGYQPINPCHHGCSKKTTWTRESCTMGHCQSRDVDCSYCNNDFYQTYDGYSKCHGCFY